jgi:putative phage-type endonuclease
MTKSKALTVLPEEKHDRRRFIGGADAAAVLGLSNFRTPYEVYLAKTSETPEELHPDKRKFFERRKRWEPVVFQMLREELEAKIVNTNVRYRDAEYDFLAAEIDAEVEDENGEIMNVEVKTVSPFAYGERHGWGESGSSEVPIDYEVQVMHGLGVTKRQKTLLVAMVGLDSMQFYPIARDDKILPLMRARLVAFWNDHILAKLAPDATQLRDLNKMYRTSKDGLVLVADNEVAVHALRLREINAQMDALQAEGERLEFQVKRAMGEAEGLEIEGKKLVAWKEQKWSRIDYAALKADRLYSKYLREGRHRVFKTLKG